MKEIDHKYTREAVCPYCGYEFSDTWDFNLQHDGDKTEVDCDCGETFWLWINIDVDYTTRKKEIK